MILESLLFISLLLSCIYIFFKRQYRFWAKHGFVHTDPSFPWGDFSGMSSIKSIAEIVTEIYKKYSGERIVGIWIFFKPVALVRDPELIKDILVRDFTSFHDRGIYTNEKDDPLSANLFAVAGADWRNMRVKLTPTFTSGKMKMMFPILVECSRQFKSILQAPAHRGEVIEVKDYAARFTTDIISLAAFGIKTDSLHNPDSEFRYYGQQIFEPTFLENMGAMLKGMAPSIAKFFSMRNIRKEVADFFLTIFKESMDYREENKLRRNDFLDLLIQLKNKGVIDDVDEHTGTSSDGTKFTFEQAAAQAFVFFLAGFETSSTTIQFALYELAKHPEIQEKAREEINIILAKHNNQVNYDSIIEMEYLGRVIDETLRMYPPVPFLQRECNKDFPVSGTKLVVPKGIPVFIDVLGLHRDPEIYPDPLKFDPDRFTEKGKENRHHYAYLPFGEGPRNCIGSRFGLMQTRVGMMTLLQNFEFNVASETPIPLIFDKNAFILTPKSGMHLKITCAKTT